MFLSTKAMGMATGVTEQILPVRSYATVAGCARPQKGYALK